MEYWDQPVTFKAAKMLERRGYFDDVDTTFKEFYDKNGNITTKPTPWPVTTWPKIEWWLQEKHEIYAVVARNYEDGPFFCSVYRLADPHGKYPEGKQPMKRVGRPGIAETYENGMVITLERAIKAVPVKPLPEADTDDLPF